MKLGLVPLWISLPSNVDSVKSFSSAFGLPFTYMMRTLGQVNALGITRVPTAFIVDSQRVLQRRPGPRPEDVLAVDMNRTICDAK